MFKPAETNSPVAVPAFTVFSAKFVAGSIRLVSGWAAGCRRLSLGVVVLLLGLLLGRADANASAPIAVDFNTSGELTNRFNDGYATPAWSQSPTVGLAGGGGITIVSNTVDLNICKQGFLLQTGMSYTVSAYYKNMDNNGYGGLGFTALTNATLGGGGLATPLSAIGVSFHGGGGMMDNNGATTSSYTSVGWGTSLQTAVKPCWFHFEVTLTCTGPGTFDQTIIIRQSDTNGNLGTVFTTTTVTGQVNSALGAATVIYPFFGASGDRFVAADNFFAAAASSLPYVTVVSTNQVAAVGGAVTLSASGSGARPLSYQWMKDGGLVLGATNSTLTLTNVGMTNSGGYYAVVTNAYGMNMSLPVTLMVGTPQLLAWGNNQYGQLGDGTTNTQYAPEITATNVITAAAGQDHSLFVKGDNTLWSVGFNGDGELGDGTQASRQTAESVATNVVAVAAGSWHSLFLQGDGTLWAVGQNFFGQLGDGTVNSRSTPFCTASNVVAMAAGYDQSYYLQCDGTLWAMGRNDSGQLGNGNFNNQSFAVAVASNVVALAGGYKHALYLQRDSTLWAMGENGNGQLGNGDTNDQNVAVTVASNVVAMAAGGFHSLYIKNDGTLWGMGENSDGQLGAGTSGDQTLAIFVANNVKTVTAGMYHSLFLMNDGTTWATGGNFDGQLGDGTFNDRWRPVPVPNVLLAGVISGNSADHTLAVGLPLPPVIVSQPTNRVVTAGNPASFTVGFAGLAPLACQWQFNGTNIAGATNASYTLDSVALTNAGNYTVVVANSGGSVTSAPASLMVDQIPATITLGNLSQTYDGTAKPVTFTTLPHGLTASLTYNGSAEAPTNAGSYTVIATIDGGTFAGSATNILEINQASPNVTQWPAAAAIRLGQTLAAATLSGGTAAVPGGFAFTNSSLTPTGTALQGVMFTPADTTNYQTATSTVEVVVLSPAGIVAGPTNRVAAAGDTVDLSVTATGNAPLAFQWFKNGGLILGATNRTLSLTNAGVANSGVYYVLVTNAYGLKLSLPVTLAVETPQLLVYGNNEYGQLGDGTTDDQFSPEVMATNVVTAVAGQDHTLFVKGDNTLWSVGFNGDGELGDGTQASRARPEFVTTNVVAVAAGAWHSLFLRGDGTLWAVGQNFSGQLGDGTSISRLTPFCTASNVVAIAAGYEQSFYLTQDGRLWAMGYNVNGQLGDGSTSARLMAVAVASNVVAVSAGYNHTLYLARDGTLFAMGLNTSGQLGDGTMSGKSLPEAVATNVVAMAAGAAHTLYLTGDGTLYAVGDNNYGQLGNGTYVNQLNAIIVTNQVQAVSAGTHHSLFLKNDGSAWAFGANYLGQLGDGTSVQRWLPIPVCGLSLAGMFSGNAADHTLAVGQVLPPVFVSQPTNLTVVAGNPAGFAVVANGLSSTTYQWLFNGTNIVGATNASYTIAQAALTNAGNYTVVVASLTELATSAVATLTVDLAVTVLATPANAGSVTGSGTYAVGSLASLTAMASNHWQFIRWSDGNTNSEYAFIVPETNVLLVAQFAPTIQVTGTVDPTNAGYVTGGGTYIVGSNAVLTAVASNDWRFIRWSDGAINPTNTFTVPETNVMLVAQFAPTVLVTGTVDPTNAGYVTGGGTYVVGSNAVLTAVASNDWRFIRWSDGTINPTNTFTVPETNVMLVAQFAPTVLVTGTSDPTNAGYVTGGGTYIVGSNAVLTATASNDWQFIQWSDGATNNPYTIQVPATNLTLTAQFGATAVITVTVQNNQGGTVTGGGTFLVGSTNPISATAAGNNWTFAQWNDGSTNNPYLIVVTTNRTYTAEFVAAALITTTANPAGGGSISGGGVHALNSTIALQAYPANHWKFLNWNGTMTNYTTTGHQANPWTGITVTQDATYQANFAKETNGFVYLVLDNFNPPQVEIIGYDGPTNGTVTIPLTIEGYKVTIIGPGAFWNNGVTNLVITGNVTNIASDSIAVAVIEFLGVGAGIVIAADAFKDVVEADLVDISADAAVEIMEDLDEALADLVSLTLNSSPDNGGHCDFSGMHEKHATVIITAHPEDGWEFVHWKNAEDIIVSSESMHTIEDLDSDAVYTGVFAQKTVELTTQVEPEDATDCKVSGGGKYAVNESVTLTAEPGEGWKFKKWEDDSTEAVRTFTAPNEAPATPYTATFVQQVAVSTVTEPEDAGTVTFDEPLDGVSPFDKGTEITLSAHANDGWRFAHWNDGSTNSTLVFTAETASTNIATFVQQVKVTTVTEPEEGGSVTGGGTYDLGAEVTLNAVTNAGWRFAHWNDDSTNSTLTFTATASSTNTATFVRVVTVTGVANPEEGGSVTGGGTYDLGAEVTLNAVTNAGWRFAHWNDDSTNSMLTFTATASSTNTATFVRVVTVTGVANPEEGGTVTGGGIYDLGAEVTLNAVTNAGWRFAHWNDDSTNSTLTITATASSTNTATFVRVVTVTGVADPEEGGLVTGGGTYDLGAEVTLNAVTNAGWRFAHWNDDSTNSTFTFTAAADVTNTATFVRLVTVTGVADPQEGGSVTGGGTYDLGAEVTLNAVTNAGWRFAHWNDNSTNSTLTFTAAADVTNTATFVRLVTVTGAADPQEGGSVTGGGTYDLGAEVTLNAVTNAGWRFAHWNDNSTNSALTFTAATDITNTATFVRLVTVTGAADPQEGGSVTGGGTYDLGVEVTLNAVTNADWRFAHWNDNSTNSALTFTTTADVTNTATFVRLVTVTGVADPEEGGSVTGGGTYDLGAEVTLNAVTNAGWRFAHWSDNSTNSTLTFTAAADVTNTATFVRLVTVTGVADPEEGGTVTGSGTYDLGAEVTLNAVTNAGWRFAHWSDDSTNSALTITASASSTNTATFVRQVIVTGVADPEEGGTVTGGGSFDLGAEVTLNAVTNNGWRFVHWKENGSTNNPLTLTASADSTNTAVFSQKVTVGAVAEPEEGGSVTGAGSYNLGAAVTLVATTNSGWRFVKWEEDGSTTNVLTFTAATDVTNTAKFVELVEVEAEAEPLYGGMVLGGGTYDDGSLVTLVAIPFPGFKFTGWFLDDLLTNAPVFITVAEPSLEIVRYKAHFARAVTVTVTANPTNAGSVTGGGLCEVGDTNTSLTATASNNWQFVSWNDGSTNNPYVITVPETNITYTANFAAVTSVTLDASSNPCGYLDGIIFTANLTPTNGTGTVQFLTNGVAFDLETLTNGVAVSLPLSSLPRGTNWITVLYSGDATNLPCTNMLAQVVTNHPPQATTVYHLLPDVTDHKILISELATNWSDVDGDVIALASVNPSTNGVAVGMSAKYIYYSNTNRVNDQFTYVISDGQGGAALGLVNLLHLPERTNVVFNITSLVRNSDGSVTVGCVGIPGYVYWMEAATNLPHPIWEVVSTNTAGPNGQWSWTDTNAASYTLRFYRTYKP